MIHLYIKTHNITGMKYFGKTMQDPFKYKGSGKYWTKHIKLHGYDVTTEILGSFTDIIECTKVALEFSANNNIVNSEQWANLMVENGQTGAPIGHPGHKFTATQLVKMSEAAKNNWQNPAYQEAMRLRNENRWTDQAKLAQSLRLSGVLRPAHAVAMSGRLPQQGFIDFITAPRSEIHKQNIANALKNKPKSESHKAALKKPKPLVVTRIHDKKLMAIGNYMNWAKKFNS